MAEPVDDVDNKHDTKVVIPGNISMSEKNYAIATPFMPIFNFIYMP